MFHVVLYQPEIPPNTGNIIRLCANTGATLHLIRPLGFDIEERSLRRAGLDYHEYARVSPHDDLTACLESLGWPTCYGYSSHASRPYSSVAYRPGDALLFGPETRGLPGDVLAAMPEEQRLTLPMRPGNRSLNLSNAVAIVVYEAWRQNRFDGSGR
jgi:tRNA (cytidine/uridine-2'-O-)-methyltransferase